MAKKPWCVSCSVVIGSTALVAAGIFYGIVPSIFRKAIREGLVLREDAPFTEKFTNPPSATTMGFYFFNVTNKEEVNSGGKAILDEVGPFLFKQYKIKNITEWDSSKGTLKYKTNFLFFFDQERTKFDLSAEINHPNLPDIALAEALATKSRFRFFTTFVFPEPPNGVIGPLIVTHKASELLFDGYKIPYLEWLQYNNPARYGILKGVGKVPEGNNFGLYYGRNDSFGKEFEVYTGQNGMENFTIIRSYDENTELDFWNSHCNDINGTDGAQFPPFVKESDTLYVFSSDVCRSLKLTYNQKVRTEGIDALRFVVAETAFADPAVNLDNECFCKEGTTCSKAGVLPLGPCQAGKPVAMSSPHFYLADPEYIQAFDFKPDKEKHQTYLDIEPLTGAVIRAKKRLQINVVTKHIEEYTTLKHAKDGYFPFIWVEEGGEIDAVNAAVFHDVMFKPRNIMEWSLIAAMIGGALIILLAGIIYYFKGAKKDSTKK